MAEIGVYEAKTNLPRQGVTMPFVLDPSVALTWVFADEATPETDALCDRLIDDHAVVPGLWTLEMANALIAAHRRGLPLATFDGALKKACKAEGVVPVI